MIYLCSPYSHPDPAIRAQRFRAACRAAAHLMAQGEMVYCPIVFGHPVAVEGGLKTDWAFWEKYDRWYLNRVDRVVVLTLDGWRESVGIQAELAIAAELGLPVEYMEPV